MALSIQTNVQSMIAQQNLKANTQALEQNQERLSSGLRINSAADDPAGLAIANRFTAQIRGQDQAIQNGQDGISLAQTAEGALDETGNMLQRMRELAIQSANSTNSASDRESLQAEVNQMQQEIDRIANNTTFNDQNILDGSLSNAQFQVGANANETINFGVDAAGTADLGVHSRTLDNTNANQGTGAVSTAAADLGSITEPIQQQTVTINHADGSKDVPQTQTGDSAKDIAASIDELSGETGVSAEASTQATLGNLQTDGTVSFDLGSSAGGSASVSASVTTGDISALADAINAETGKTGISAEVGSDTSTLSLKESEGADIQVSNYTHSSGTAGDSIDLSDPDSQATTLEGDGGDNAAIATGTLDLTSEDSFSVQSNVANSAGSVVDAATAGNAVNSSEENVNGVDIGSVQGANDAISVLDTAIQQVSGIRADLGAVQNRFDSTIANLETANQNFTESRSRIQDADIAKEAAEQTQNNIRRQAASSVLAQANQNQQIALQLLGGG
ncbi:flagellin N-terminal helical domain-containing protein [Thiohalorhabdus sp.]|uniref:flagellin N-terminal helical domain-containing protein n=1 Tax=Thiohalorhabdus sp. TaxID=3094134 RepID=UPI002FC351E5